VQLKRPITTFSAIGFATAGALALASPAHAAVVTIPINDGNVPTTAAGFETQSCDQVPTDRAVWEDGWVFVLPASAGAEGNFISVTATYEDELGNTYHYTTDEDGGVVDGSGDNKAYILTPAGLTLVGAEADVNDPDDGAFFNLTHACAAEGEVPEEELPSPEIPTDEPSSEAPTEEGSESASPGEASTSPAAQLPTTGTPLTIALVSAAALAAGGAALYMIQRRRREAQDW
jgi:LPXTG-motif cell wall-anchored protein